MQAFFHFIAPFIGGFIWGTFGGCLPIAYALYSLKEKEAHERPLCTKSGYYYRISVAMAVIGGIFVLLYLASGSKLNPLLEVHIGASAPFLIKQLARTVPDLGDS